MYRKVYMLGIALILALSLAACGGGSATPAATPTGETTVQSTQEASPSATQAAGIPSGWTVFDKSAEGFKVALPDSWQEFKMDPADLDAELAKIKEQDPQLAQMMEQLSSSGINYNFFGVDSSKEALSADFATNANVLKEELNVEVTLETYVNANLANMEKLDSISKPIEHERVSGGLSEVEKLKYTMTTGEGGEPVIITQFVAMKGSQGVILTLTTSESQYDKYASMFDQAGKYFEIVQ